MPDYDDPFDAPGGDLFSWESHHGRLLLITPHSVEREIKTRHGDSDAVRADIVVLAEPGTGPVLEVWDTLIFPRVIQSRVRGQIGSGRMTLGRLGQGEPERGNPPWILLDPTEADRATARAYLDGRSGGGRTAGARTGQGSPSRPSPSVPPF